MRRINEVSTLTFRENIELRATLHALENRDFICSVCTEPDFRPDADAMVEAKKKQKACTEIRNFALHNIKDGRLNLLFATCPGNFFSEGALHMIQAHELFEKGVMPFPGSYMEQPAKVIDIMSIIGSYKAQRILAKAEKERMQSKMQNLGMKNGR